MCERSFRVHQTVKRLMRTFISVKAAKTYFNKYNYITHNVFCQLKWHIISISNNSVIIFLPLAQHNFTITFAYPSNIGTLGEFLVDVNIIPHPAKVFYQRGFEISQLLVAVLSFYAEISAVQWIFNRYMRIRYPPPTPRWLAALSRNAGFLSWNGGFLYCKGAENVV